RALVGVVDPAAGRQLVLGAADVLPARRERARLQRRDGVVRAALLAVAGARLRAGYELRAVGDGGGGGRYGGGLPAAAAGGGVVAGGRHDGRLADRLLGIAHPPDQPRAARTGVLRLCRAGRR